MNHLKPRVTVVGTSKELAAKLGIARSTVSMALADHPLISPATRRRVQQTAARLNYAPNRVARAMRTGKTHVLGVIVPSVRISHFPDIVDTIERESKKAGYRCLLCQSHDVNENFEADVRLLLGQQVDGLLLAPTATFPEQELYRHLLRQEVPMVLLDHERDGLEASSVHIDNVQIGRMAAEHLLQLGHRRIAYVRGPDNSPNARLRLAGYCRALQSAGIVVDEQLIVGSGYEFQDGSRAAEDLLNKGVPFTALAATTDMAAIGAMKTLQTRGLRVPEDVSVVGCANLDMATMVTPSLTTLDGRPAEIAAAATHLLLDQLKHGTRKVENIVVPSSLVVRDSTTKAPKQVTPTERG